MVNTTQRTLRKNLKLVHLLITDKSCYRIVNQVLKDHLTYLDASALADLYDCVSNLEKENRAGILIETGCALGGSALTITASKRITRPFYIYDVFGMIPPPSEFDGSDVHTRYNVIASGKSHGLGKRKYYGYEENLLEHVRETFESYGYPVEKHKVHLVKGLFQNTLSINEPVAFAHLDCDWYESVLLCLQRIEPHLVKSGTLVIDDYYHWSGCQKAVEYYFADKKSRFKFVKKSRLHIVRIV
ncbi:MAG: asparagine synthase [Chloroflexi bacterium]|nr:asparagine synthase [Chloroflexota bacterium]